MCKKEYVNRNNGKKLNLNELEYLADNSLLKNRPDIWEFWDFKKNIELGMDIKNLKMNNDKKFYFICKSCNSSNLKLFNKNITDNDCCECRLLKNKCPSIFKELHPTKNEGVNLNKLTYGSNARVWWLGECGHEWERPVKRRTTNSEGCIYCSGNRNTLIGFNDMWTTNPKLAKLLLNPKDGYRYMQNSNAYVDWKCPKCETILPNQKISKVNCYGLTCAYCSDGFSFATKVLISILKQANITFKTEKTFLWSGKFRYDFYFELKDLSYIVELHGMQHYGRGFTHNKKWSLDRIQNNDDTKMKLANINGISRYIVIDCRHSELEWIRNNLIKSELSNIIKFDSIDWSQVLTEVNNSYMMKSLCYWNDGFKSTSKIADVMGISRQTVLKYLKILAKDGLCDYSVDYHNKNKKGDVSYE